MNVQPNLGTKNISDNGTYTASADQLDGYSSVTVAVSKDFYPKAHATLDDASRVEGDDMRVYPMGGTDYYPYVYLSVKPYGTQEEYEPVGKYFAGQTQEHTVTTFLDLIDVATGESVSGYPQRVAPSWSVSIVDGGYMKIVSWTVKASGAVSVVTERYNPTYTKPLQDTKDSTAVTGGKLDAYLDTSYYIDGGAGESVLLQSLTATANGTYTAPARTAYNTVTVDVQEQPWQPLQDGYSNFWFELTNDTLSPWLNFSSKNNDAVIDWGDGSGEVTLDTLTPTHTYAKVGKYVVKVKGVTGINQQNTAPYSNMRILKYVELNSEVTSINPNAFLYCVGLVFITTSTALMARAMCYRCTSLKSISLLSGVSQISQNALRECYSLESVELPQTVTSIGGYAFYTDATLTSVTIPSLVESISDYAFNGCASLAEVHCLPTVPPTLGTNVFLGLPANWLCYVPVGYGETYKAAAEWSDYADHILEEGQTPNRAMLSRLAKAVETDTDTDTDTEEKR